MSLVSRFPLRRAVLAAALLAMLAPVQAAELPRSADLDYRVSWGVLSLQAEQHWRLDGGRYTLSTELKLPLAFKNRRYVSQGRIGPQGLEPDSYEDFELGDPQPRTVARVDRSARQLSYGQPAKKLRSVALPDGLQDMNALAYQLMFLGPQAVPATLPVTNGKGVVNHRFQRQPDASVTVDGRSWPVQVLASQSQEGGIEVSLAPDLGLLPLKVVRTQDGRTLSFTATRIRVTR